MSLSRRKSSKFQRHSISWLPVRKIRMLSPHTVVKNAERVLQSEFYHQRAHAPEWKRSECLQVAFAVSVDEALVSLDDVDEDVDDELGLSPFFSDSAAFFRLSEA
jgi:hypothetical protein